MTIHRHHFGWLTHFISTVTHDRPDRLVHYLSLTRKDLHFVGLIGALADIDTASDDKLLWLDAQLFAVPRRKLLACIAPDLDKAILKLPGRLSGRLWQAQSYRRLASLCSEPTASKWLRHRRCIRRRQVHWLGKLPPAFRCDTVMKLIGKRTSVENVCFAIDIVRRIRPELTDAQIVKSMEGIQHGYVDGWVTRHYRHVSFPPAPWPGTEALRPLTSFDQLRRSALEFKNCIRTYLDQILSGTGYFYRFEKDGKGVAIVELRRVPGVGWVVNEMLGPDNDELSIHTRTEIRAIAVENGLLIAPQSWLVDSYLRQDVA